MLDTYINPAETGLYYVFSRYYDPAVGRFSSADTTDVLDVQSDLYDKNLYAYCDNNPVMRKDSSGQVWITVGIMAVSGVIGGVIGAVSSAVTQNTLTGTINWKSVAVAGGAGFVSGAVAASPLGLGWQMGIGAGIAKAAICVAGASATAALVTNVVENTSTKTRYRNQSVYVMRNSTTKEVQYVGRTNNPVRRQKEHDRDPNKEHLDPLEVKFTGLTRIEARVVEQLVISAYTIENLANARREIAVGNVSGFTGKMNNIINIFGGAAESELLNLMGR